ncbi:Transcription repressor OFP14 [Glycine max]|nr:Transcription repressor OFP14 [Glycine max]
MDPKLKKIPKSLRDYLFKIKTHQRTHIKLPSKKWILTSCKHPRTPSLDIDNMKNMHRQLRQRRRSHVSGHRPTRQQSRKVSRTGPHAIRFDSYRRFDESPLNLFTVTTTEAGSSSATSESEIAEEQTVIPGNCVVVLANSVNPSKDFQRSMESVVEARLRNCEKVDWDFMQELLFCHMNLNNKNAFVDVVIAMRSPSDIAPVKLRTVRIGRKVQKKTRKQLPWNLGRHHKLLVGGRVFNLRRKS